MNEAELLFAEILGCQRVSLYLNKSLHLNKDKSSFVSSVLKRRIGLEPIQYILGKTEFMGLEFKLNTDVLIPRPETEILVETVIRIGYQAIRLSGYPVKILDIGTGSGCIAVSLTKFLPNVDITATDISFSALGVAKENAKLNNVNVNFIHSDLFATSGLQLTTYDIIVCNPPYIPSAEIHTLQPEIRYEPRIALDGGKDGLDLYRRIIKDSPCYLKEGGFLILEMGFNQLDAIEKIFQDCGHFQIIEVVRDYNNINRVIVAQKY